MVISSHARSEAYTHPYVAEVLFQSTPEKIGTEYNQATGIQKPIFDANLKSLDTIQANSYEELWEKAKKLHPKPLLRWLRNPKMERMGTSLV